MKRSCMVCGNTRQSELELLVLLSDGEGNDCEELVYICKEGKGCNK